MLAISDAVPDDVKSLLKAHSKWIQSSGREGTQLNLANRDLDNIQLSNGDWSVANFKRATLRSARLDGCIFQFTDFSGADLTGANLAKCDFRGANLAAAKLSGTNLDQAVFSPMPIRRPDGTSTGQFHKTNVSGADFTRALFNKTDFRGINVADTIMEGANTAKAYFDPPP
jgi:uncharacterized protein YjbI with pentapeptide repeats